MKPRMRRRWVAAGFAILILSSGLVLASAGPASAETTCTLNSWTKGSLMWDDVIIQTGIEDQINGYFHAAGFSGCWGRGLYTLRVDTTHTRCYNNLNVAPIVITSQSCTYGIDKSYWYTYNGVKRYYWAKWSITYHVAWVNGTTGKKGTFELTSWFRVHESGDLTWDSTFTNVSGDPLIYKDFRKSNGGFGSGTGL